MIKELSWEGNIGGAQQLTVGWIPIPQTVIHHKFAIVLKCNLRYKTQTEEYKYPVSFLLFLRHCWERGGGGGLFNIYTSIF